MGAMQRRKGAAAEREVCKMLRDELGIDAKRNLSQTREGGHDLLNVLGYAVEVKHHARVNVKAAWQQACEQAKRVGLVPALFYKENFKGWRVRLPDPSVWAAEQNWREEVCWTLDMDPQLFFFRVREG